MSNIQQDRKRTRRAALTIASDELLDCLTAAMNHSDFFGSCNDEDAERFKRSRRSCNSERSSLSSLGSQLDDDSFCGELEQTIPALTTEGLAVLSLGKRKCFAEHSSIFR